MLRQKFVKINRKLLLDQIREEKPESWLVLWASRHGKCFGCNQKCWNLKYCGHCSRARYCSLKCQKQDWRKHKVSCFKKFDSYHGVYLEVPSLPLLEEEWTELIPRILKIIKEDRIDPNFIYLKETEHWNGW